MYVNLESIVDELEKWQTVISLTSSASNPSRSSTTFWSFEPDTSRTSDHRIVLSRKSSRIVVIALPQRPRATYRLSRLKPPVDYESTLRKRRGVVRASITRLTNRLKELEGDTDSPVTLDLAGGMTRKLDALDTEFRAHHQALVDLIDDEEALLTEQNTLDDHDDHVAVLTARVRQLVSACTPSSDLSLRKIASRRLSHLQKSLSSVRMAITTSGEEPLDVCLLRQYEHRLYRLRNRDWKRITCTRSYCIASCPRYGG